MSKVSQVLVILVFGLFPIQISEAAISNAIELGKIMTEITLVSDQTNSRPGKPRVDGIWPETITIDYNPKYSFKKIRIPEEIDLGDINKEVLDRCLLAIANEPNLFERIDQRNFFNKDDVYLDVLRKTLNIASQFIPYDINNPAIFSDVNKPDYLKASLCLADSRVYFWNALNDRDVIGWASIQISGIINMKIAREPKLTVWIVPRLNKTTSFVKELNEYSKQRSDALKALIKLALDTDIKDTNNDIEQLLGKIKTNTNRYHNVKYVMSGNIFQMEINLIENESQSLSGGMVPPAVPAEIYIDYVGGNKVRVLNGWDTSLPFWPPKTEDNKKESPN